MKKIIFLLVIVTIASYWNVLGHSFVWDDHFTIEENELIRHFRHIPKIFATDLFHSHAEKTGTEHSNYYRPVQTLSFFLDYQLWRLNPAGYHLTSVVIHLLNGILVFLVVFFIARSKMVSVFSSVLFLVHPVQTGAVTYLTGRSDLLALFFVLVSFLSYLLRASLPAPEAAGKVDPDTFFNRLALKKGLLYKVSLAAFLLALLSKEVAVIYPLIILFYELVFGRRVKLHRENMLGIFLPYLLIAVFYGALRVMILNFTPVKPLLQSSDALAGLFLTMGRTFVEYINILIFPTNLHMEREVLLVPSAFSLQAALAIAGSVFYLMALTVSYKRFPSTFFGLIWFVIFLLPVSNIVPINALMAEHWLYLPSVGFFMALGIALCRLRVPRLGLDLSLWIFALAAFFYCGGTLSRNMDWKDDLSIYRSTLDDSPRKGKMYYNMGTVYHERGNYNEALRYYRLAVENGLYKAGVRTNIGGIYLETGNLEKAEEMFRAALTIDPSEHFAHNGLGCAYEMQGELEKARLQYQRALEIYPDFYDANVNLAAIYDKQGKMGRAVHYFKKAYQVRKDRISFENLKNACLKAGIELGHSATP